jgi:hypothetical protein
MTLQEELAHVLNKHSAENGSGTPDFILAGFVTGALRAFDESVAAREKWYGRPTNTISASAEELAQARV